MFFCVEGEVENRGGGGVSEEEEAEEEEAEAEVGTKDFFWDFTFELIGCADKGDEEDICFGDCLLIAFEWLNFLSSMASK